MKTNIYLRLALSLFVLLSALSLCACKLCQHRDADDNDLCDSCGIAYTDGIDNTAHTHNFSLKSIADDYIATPADCENAATYYYTCACGEMGSKTFANGKPTGHTPGAEVQENRTEPTCSSEGSLELAVYCSVCDAELSRETITLNKLAHTFTEKNTGIGYLKNAACCESAATYYYSCKCGAVGSEAFEYGTPTGVHTDLDADFACDACKTFVLLSDNFEINNNVTISFYHTLGMGQRSILEKYIGKFNEIYPNITIENTQVGSYDDVYDRISKEITVNAQPNIAFCYPDHVAIYNKIGVSVTLDNLMASTATLTRPDGTTEILGFTDAQIADFIPGFLNDGKQFGDGKMYTLPFSKSTELLYYNKTFFDEHNLTVPTTWEEMEALCAKIKLIDPSSIPLGYDSEANWFITLCEQYGYPYTSIEGEEKFLFDDERNYELAKMLNKWYYQRYVTTQELFGTYTSQMFVSDAYGSKCYMCIGSSSGATRQLPDYINGKYAFEVGIAPIPQKDVLNPKVICQGPSVCIFDGTPEEIVASWLFIKFLTTSPEFQAEYSMQTGYMPVIKSCENIPLYRAFLEKADGGDFITALATKRSLEQMEAYFTPPAFIGSAKAKEEVGMLLRVCMVYEGTDLDAYIKKAFADAVERCKESID